MTVMEERNDPWKKLDDVTEALHLTNINIAKVSGQMDLIKQQQENTELIAKLREQVQEKQMVRLEENMALIIKDQAVMKTQITRAQAMFAIIASVAMIVVSVAKDFVVKILGG